MSKYGIFKCNKCGDVFSVKLKNNKDIYHECTGWTSSRDITFLYEG